MLKYERYDFKNYVDFSFESSRNTRQNNYFIPSYKVNGHWGKNALKYIAVSHWLNLPKHVTSNVYNFYKFKKACNLYSLALQKEDYCNEVAENEIEEYTSCIEYVIENIVPKIN